LSFNPEPLKTTLSKIAPLEQWDLSWSSAGPKVCWQLFRPSPQHVRELWSAIQGFEGHTQWHGVDHCLVPFSGRALLAPSMAAAFTTPLHETPLSAQVNEEEVSSDLEQLAIQIEKQLGLRDVSPMPFSDWLLTKEGLRQSRGPFEDFLDGGQRLAYLIVDPKSLEVCTATEADIGLHFEPMCDEITAICGDLVGADLTRREFQSMTNEEVERIQGSYPCFWKVADYYEEAYLNPHMAHALYEECLALEQMVSSPKGMRGMDKLKRIANWAVVKHYGVLLDPP
jgi:hypothetical protein